MSGTSKIAAIILAAGRSTRMGDVNKLLVDFNGKPMIAQTVGQVKVSVIEQILVVTGHQADEVRRALSGHQVQFVENDEFHRGMATSLVAGIGALDTDVEGVLIVLGDMPLVTGGNIDALVERFSKPDDICLPVFKGKCGNPVLWGREYFSVLQKLQGDRGAKRFLEQYQNNIIEVQSDGDAILRDFDTKNSLP